MKLRDTLFKFGTEFQAERSRTITNPKKPSIPPGNTLAKWISREIPKIFEEIFQKELDGFQVHASAGDGQWVSAPWIAILHPKVSLQPNGRVSPQCGYYPVYAADKEEKFIMFSLGQGEYNIRINFPKDVDHKLIDGAINLRKKVPEYKANFINVSKINLDRKATNKKSERWVKSCAFGKIYKIKKLPTEEELKKDLIEMMKLFKLAIERGGVIEGTSNKIYIDQDHQTSTEKAMQKHITKENEIVIKTDPKFINKLKKDCDYTCQACGLKYEKIYGNYSKKKDFIEAHHIEPKFKVKKKAEINKKMSRSAKDFAMLCANCHRMIHRMMRKEKDRVISLKEFKSKINEKFKENIKNLN
jgi:5-methylcytosine-specific restriction enzyme A